MPQVQAKTTNAKEIWKSPDGQRVIYEVTIDVDGNPMTAKTYSKAISEIGWSGTVESYEKAGRNGSETFLKQPPKEGGFTPGGYSGGGKSYAPKGDNFTMFLSYAKDIAVALIEADKYSVEQLAEIVNDVGTAGMQLYDMRPDATEKPAESKSVEVKTQSIDDLMGDALKGL